MTDKNTAKATRNLKSDPLASLIWKGADPDSSLEGLFKYVEGEADKAMAWYWQKKGPKALLSRTIQFSAVVLTALGALIPVAINILRGPLKLGDVDTGLWASLFVGLAAALIGVDRAFGYSSGWARYVLTATTIRKFLEEFRMDWMALSAKSGTGVNPDQSAAFIARARDFMVGVHAMVLQETKDWVTEFQNSIAQLDKEVAARLEALKSEVEKAAQAEAATAQPGSIELAVPNSDKADGFSFDVLMEGSEGKIAEEKIIGKKKWVQINVPPGQYKVSIDATAGGKPANTVIAILIKPQEITRFEVPLPL